MKFIHTSDLHLGRSFMNFSLEEDHQIILDQVLEAIDVYQPDALFIPGDIFDRTVPPDTAIGQFSDFIRSVRARGVATAFMAGNHDSAEKIGSFGVLSESDVLVCGRPEREPKPLILKDEHGDVAITVLPFTYEYAAQRCFGNLELKTPADVLAAQVDAARSMVPEDVRWVILAHTFVVGGKSSESERNLGRVVGGIETVPADVFSGAHYVALGHLHSAQTVGSETVQYCGSPLAFGFDETGQEKSMTLVEIDGAGTVTSQRIPFRPKRNLRIIRGRFEDLLAIAEPSEDFIKIVLTDPEPVIDPMRRLREFYPSACQMIYEREERSQEMPETDFADGTTEDPIDLMTSFMTAVRDGEVSKEEAVLMAQTLRSVEQENSESGGVKG